MDKRIVSLTTAGLAMLCGCAPESTASTVERVQSAVGTIYAYGDNGELIGQGTGFFVDETTVVTNYHVLLGATSATLQLEAGAQAEISGVIADDITADLLVLRANTAWPHYLDRSVSEMKVGTPILVVGSPLGLERTVSDGIIAATRTTAGVAGLVQFTAPVSPGSSGGPVVDIRGRLVGIVTSQMAQGQNLNFASPASRLAGLRSDLEIEPLASWRAHALAGLLDRADSFAAMPAEHQRDLFLFRRKPSAADAIQAQQLYELVLSVDSAQWRAWAGLGELTVDAFSAEDHRIRSHKYRDMFERAVDFNPRFLHGYDMIAHALGMSIAWGQGTVHDVEQLVLNGQRAVDGNPNDPAAHVLIGSAFETAERADLAIVAYRRAIQLQPDYADAYYNLGSLYQRLGERGLARAQAQRLRALGEDCRADIVERRFGCVDRTIGTAPNDR